MGWSLGRPVDNTNDMSTDASIHNISEHKLACTSLEILYACVFNLKF